MIDLGARRRIRSIEAMLTRLEPAQQFLPVPPVTISQGEKGTAIGCNVDINNARHFRLVEGSPAYDNGQYNGMLQYSDDGENWDDAISQEMVWITDFGGVTHANDDLVIAIPVIDQYGKQLVLPGGYYWVAVAPGYGNALTNTTYWRKVIGPITPTAWSALTTYVIGNLVSNGGLTYLCILGHINFSPPNATYWLPVVLTDLGTFEITLSYVVGNYVQDMRPIYVMDSGSVGGSGTENYVVVWDGSNMLGIRDFYFNTTDYQLTLGSDTNIGKFTIAGPYGGSTFGVALSGYGGISGTHAGLYDTNGHAMIEAIPGSKFYLGPSRNVQLLEAAASGAIGTTLTTFPGDPYIANSQVIWGYDDTAGDPKVRWRGKDSAGTAFTFTLASTSVSSVSNSDGTLTISPTTGAVIASVNLAHAFTWTNKHKINANHTDCFIVEYTGTRNNVFVVDTTNGRIGFNQAATYLFGITGIVPATVTGGVIGTAADAVNWVLANGGANTTVTGNPIGGAGSNITITCGNGGIASGGTTQNRGALGGSITITSGSGGSPVSSGSVNALGGQGGAFTFTSGNGGGPISSTGTATAGAAGAFTFTGGAGGNAVSGAATTCSGGAGAAITFTSGNGGSATGTGATTNTGGAGGAITFNAGTGGAASGGGTNNNGGNGGTVFNVGGSNAAATANEIRFYHTGTLRYEINSTDQVFYGSTRFTTTITVGTAGGTTGAVLLKSLSSGTVTLSVADGAGTYTLKLPTSIGSSTNVLSTDGVKQTSWIAGTISGKALGSNLENLTATDTSLTFSGSYNGSTARTVGINVGHTNTWTITQAFNAGLTVGSNGGSTGTIAIRGSSSGAVTLTVAAAAGTWTMTLPNSAGSSGNVMITNGSGTMSWVAGTISGIALGSNLANLTATDATLTFSGTYNGSTARTIGINLGNSNKWNAIQELPGVTNASNATTGYEGEYMSSLVAEGSKVSGATTTAENMTTLSLTAGDWDVEGHVNFYLDTLDAGEFQIEAGFNTTTKTLPTDGTQHYCMVEFADVTTGYTTITLTRKRYNVNTNTTVYCVFKSTYSGTDIAAFGSMTARRVR